MSPPDHFALFSLPARFEMDVAELERRYLALSRQLHPDRHATASASERLTSVQKTTDLNEAYRVLRDDFRRAELLLRMRGIETSEDKAHDARTKVDTRLLVEIMELRESLEEARGSRNEQAIAALRSEVEARSQAAWACIRTDFDALDRGDLGVLPSLAKAVISLRYYRRILDEMSDFEDA